MVSEGCAAVRLTVHVPEPPGATLLGAQAMLDRIAVVVVKDRVKAFDEPLSEALTVAV